MVRPVYINIVGTLRAASEISRDASQCVRKEIKTKCRNRNYNSSSIRGGVALRRRGVNYKEKARLVHTIYNFCHPERNEDVLLRTSYEKSRPIAQLSKLCVFRSFVTTFLYMTMRVVPYK